MLNNLGKQINNQIIFLTDKLFLFSYHTDGSEQMSDIVNSGYGFFQRYISIPFSKIFGDLHLTAIFSLLSEPGSAAQNTAGWISSLSASCGYRDYNIYVYIKNSSQNFNYGDLGVRIFGIASI